MARWDEMQRQQQCDRETLIAKLWNVTGGGSDYGVDAADERLLKRKLKEINGQV